MSSLRSLPLCSVAVTAASLIQSSPSPSTPTTCAHVFTFGHCARIERRAFGRPSVGVYICPVCGTERRLVHNWRGSTPPGGFHCGAPLVHTVTP